MAKIVEEFMEALKFDLKTVKKMRDNAANTVIYLKTLEKSEEIDELIKNYNNEVESHDGLFKRYPDLTIELFGEDFAKSIGISVKLKNSEPELPQND